LPVLDVGLFAFDVLPVVEFDVFAAGATVAGGVLLVMAFAGRLFAGALLAASPQAMPRAPNVRTAESAITFFIFINDSCLFLKDMSR
jgi:hypothetical protein